MKRENAKTEFLLAFEGERFWFLVCGCSWGGGAVQYWLYDHWHGNSITIVSPSDGTVKTVRVHTPEEMMKVMLGEVKK